MLFILLVDASMSHTKLDIQKKAVQILIEKIPQESYILLGVSNSSGLDMLTPEPMRCSSSVKEKLSAELKDLLENDSVDHPMDISAALLSSLEMNMGGQNNLPRTVVILSNGTICNKAEVDALLRKSLKCHNSRVSAIGIGNGSSDSFLRTIASKGLGIFEILTGTSHIEEKLDMFMKRLRLPAINNIQFDTKGENNILTILPVLHPNQCLIKGLPIEIFVYLKEKNQPVEGSKKIQQITMTYDDLEGKKTSQSILIALSSVDENPNAGDFHKVIVNRLLMSAEDLKLEGKDKHLISAYGEDWAKKIALEHQILTPATSFLAVAESLPEGFDILNGDLSVFRKESNIAHGEVKFVKPVLGSDATQSFKSGMIEKDFSSARFHKKNFSKLSNRISKNNSDNELRTRTSSKISSIPQRSDLDSTEVATNDSLNTDIYYEIMADKGSEYQAPDNCYMGSGKTTKKPDSRSPPDRRRSLNPLIPIAESDDESRSRSNSATRDSPKLPIKEITIQPTKSANEEKIAEFVSTCQQPEGNWKIEASILTELGITEDGLSTTATNLKLDSETVLVILCMSYLENSKYVDKFKLGMKFLLKVKKAKYSDISKHVISALRG